MSLLRDRNENDCMREFQLYLKECRRNAEATLGQKGAFHEARKGGKDWEERKGAGQGGGGAG